MPKRSDMATVRSSMLASLFLAAFATIIFAFSGAASKAKTFPEGPIRLAAGSA